MKPIKRMGGVQPGSLVFARRRGIAKALSQPLRVPAWPLVPIIVGLICMASVRLALAQPALERLERQVRKKVAQKADDAKRPANEPSADDRIGYLGVIADDSDVSGLGVRIVKVVEGAPSEKAGLRVGDLVTKIGDRLVRDLDDFAAALHNMPVGRKLRFTIERNFEPRRIEVTLGKRPPKEDRPVPEFGRIGDAAAPAPPRMSLLGVRVEEVDAETQAAAGLPDTKGAMVIHITEGSPADVAGVPERAVIVAVDGKQVASPTDLKRLVATAGPGKEIRLDYYDRGKLIERRLRLAELAGANGGAEPAASDEPQTDLEEAPVTREPLTPQQRIERLEDRVHHLEARLKELERLLSKPRG